MSWTSLRSHAQASLCYVVQAARLHGCWKKRRANGVVPTAGAMHGLQAQPRAWPMCQGTARVKRIWDVEMDSTISEPAGARSVVKGAPEGQGAIVLHGPLTLLGQII
jgi:hypothetical protein